MNAPAHSPLPWQWRPAGEGQASVVAADGTVIFDVEIDGKEDRENFWFLLTAVNLCDCFARHRTIELLRAAHDELERQGAGMSPPAQEIAIFIAACEAGTVNLPRTEAAVPVFTVHQADGDEVTDAAADERGAA